MVSGRIQDFRKGGLVTCQALKYSVLAHTDAVFLSFSTRIGSFPKGGESSKMGGGGGGGGGRP